MQKGDTSDSVFASSDHATTTLRCLNDLRSSGELCDVILDVSNRQIRAHRAVLAANSAYFRAMFSTSGLRETRERTIVLRGETDARTIAALIDFAYTSQIVVSHANVERLLATSDCYQFVGVKNACCDFLVENLSPTNCLRVDELARTYACASRVAAAARRFAQRHFVDVTKGAEFFASSLETVVELARLNYLNVVSEDDVVEAIVTWVKRQNFSNDEPISLLPLLESIRLAFVSSSHLALLWDLVGVASDSTECRRLLDCVVSVCSTPILRFQYRHERWSQPRRRNGFSEVIVAAGGQAGSGSLSSVEQYHMINRKWSPLSSMTSSRFGLALVSVDDQLCALGGYNQTDGFVKTMEWLDTNTGEWQVKGKTMNQPRRYFGAVQVCGLIYAIGGHDGKATPLRSAQRYDPNADKWYNLAPMTERRMYAGVIESDGFLFVVGGHNGKQRLDTVECYNLETDTWRSIAPLPSCRSTVGLATCGGSLYAVGGYSRQDYLASCDIYDIRLNQWIPGPSLNFSRAAACVGCCEGVIYACGGFSKGFMGSVEVLAPSSNAWEVVESMSTAKAHFASAIL